MTNHEYGGLAHAAERGVATASGVCGACDTSSKCQRVNRCMPSGNSRPSRSGVTRPARARNAVCSVPAATNPAVRREKIGVRNKQFGREGEELAARYLVEKGFEIIARNWTCSAGEADIIARDDDTLVFVEVKTRSNLNKGFPSDAVDERKRNKYERIAAYFTARFDADSIPVRFDVVSLLVNEGRASIRHHVNAFGAA